MEPAQTIIRKLGGPTAVAGIVQIHRTRVSSWQRSQARGGTGGRIPQGHIPMLLQAARERGVELSADDFLPPSTQPSEQGDHQDDAGADDGPPSNSIDAHEAAS